MESFIDDAKEKWDGLEDIDKLAIGGAGVLILGGALISLFSRSATPFLGGALVGAVLIGGRIILKPKDDPLTTERVPNPSRTSVPARREIDYTYGGGELGAPIGRMVDNGPVQTFNGLVTQDEARDYPMWHRHVEVDVRTDPLDDRIRWATNAPLGPYRGSTVTGFW